MTRRMMVTAGLALMLMLGVVIPMQAAEGDQTRSARVAVVVQVSAPPIVDGAVVAGAALRHLGEAFKDSEKLTLIDPERTQQATRRLGLGARPSERAIRALADALEAERVVIVRLDVRDGFQVALQGRVFNARGQERFEFHTTVGARELDDAIERMGNVLVHHLLPALLKP